MNDTRPKTTGEYLEEGEQMMEQKTGPSATLGFFHSEQSTMVQPCIRSVFYKLEYLRQQVIILTWLN